MARTSSDTAGAQFVYKSWLDADGELDLIRDYLLPWLEVNWFRESAVFVTKVISQIDDMPPEAVNYVAAWARFHPTNEDAIYRISRISRYAYFSTVDENIRNFILTASWSVLSHVLLDQNTSYEQQHPAGILITNLLSTHEYLNKTPLILSQMFSSAVKNGGVFRVESELIYNPFLALALRRALEYGFLDPEKDRDVIRRFVQWMRSASSNGDVERWLSSPGFSEWTSVLGLSET